MTIREVQVNGAVLPVHFGSAALSAFLDEVGATLADLQSGEFAQKLTYRHTLLIAFYGIKDGHRKQRKDFSLTFDDIADAVDENPDLLQICMTAFAESNGGQDTGKAKGAKGKRP